MIEGINCAFRTLKFQFIMDWVNYETSVVNPLKTKDGRFPEENNSLRVL